MASKQHQLKVNQLLTDLTSGNETKIATAIKAFHVHGDASIIIPVLTVWKDGLSAENEALVKELLIGLKDTTCVDVLIAAYRDSSFQKIKRDLTAVFWNAKLDFSPYLADFVLFAIEGDFLDAFEAVTLIEQFENTSPEHAVMESQLLLKEYFGSDENRDAQKDQLLSDIALILKEYDEESGTEDLFFE